MMVEFLLPTSQGPRLSGLLQEIEVWCQRHCIQCTQKTYKFTHRLCFDDDDLYSFFAVSWVYNKFKWRIVDLDRR